MATPSYSDNVEETSTASGTTNLTLNGPTLGSVSFFSVFSTTLPFEYLIDEEGGAWESGLGIMLDASTMIRSSVKKTHAGGGDTFVNFTGATKTIQGKKTGSQQTEDAKQIVRKIRRNETGSTLTKIVAVADSGWNSTEELPLISLADKSSGGPSIGLVEADISNNANGKVVQIGDIINVNTSAWTLGDTLYLGTAGGLTTTPPTTGRVQILGIVARSHATTGVVACGPSALHALLALAGGTMTGSILMSTRDITGLRNAGFAATLYDAGNKTGASQNINWTNGDKQKCTLTGNVSSSTFTAPPAVGGGLWLQMIQDGTGSRSFAWPASVKWDRLVTPTLSTAAGASDNLFFAWDGTNYIGSQHKGSA